MIGRRRTWGAAIAPVAPRIDAAGRRVDALARELAAPISRRRALGVLGAATAAAVLPAAIRPGRALAATGRVTPGGPQCGHIRCIQEAVCCPGPFGPSQCCPDTKAWRCDSGGACQPTGLCDDGREYCGHAGCCPEGSDCVKGRCTEPCPPRHDRCGSTCCGPREKCEDGRRCVRCRRGEEACGDTCCGKGEFCCDPAKGLCCKDGKASCCFDTEDEHGFCCAKPAECAREIDGLGGAIRPDAKRVCCPRERLVPFTHRFGCCPAGTVSMGGKLIVLAGGGDGGFCCREEFACGDTCCTNNQYFQQVCRDGRCVEADPARR
ncbi:MAG TPA: hypothetical protein VFR97_05435 [Capillimicrobium sp.]|nr:hypothetical protein [Capillimicrobium sp.]